MKQEHILVTVFPRRNLNPFGVWEWRIFVKGRLKRSGYATNKDGITAYEGAFKYSQEALSELLALD